MLKKFLVWLFVNKNHQSIKQKERKFGKNFECDYLWIIITNLLSKKREIGNCVI